MTARSPRQSHRTATPLELFFDLVFVVAIAQASAGLHHAVAEAHTLEGVIGFLMVFFAIWWAWVNFTWFASAYDSDDVPYRLAVLCQMTGALIVAAGVPAMFETRMVNGATVGGYVVMRLAAVAQWLRAAASDPEHRTTARRYAIGITGLQIAWVALLFAPAFTAPGFVLLATLELLVPAWAERARQTTWHPHHIAERYGLFTLIVLGESILAATFAVESGLRSDDSLASVVPIAAGGLLTVYSMWWLYFDRPVHDLLTNLRKALVWGYGHYFVFGAAAAVGAGLAVAVDQATHHSPVSATAAGAAVAVPVAVFLISLWVIHYRPAYRRTLMSLMSGPIAAALVLLTPFTGIAVPLIGIVLASLVALKLIAARTAGGEVGAVLAPANRPGRGTMNDPMPSQPEDQDPAELDDPNAGNPDRDPGEDNPDQRPITDNKAGG